MNTINKRDDSRCNDARHRGGRMAALALGLALALGPGTSAMASGWPVFDIGNWVQNYLDRLQSEAEFGKDEGRWLALLQQVKDAVIKTQAIFDTLGLPPGATLSPVPEDYMVVQSCGKATGDSPGDLFKYFVFNPTDDVKTQQRQICVNIRMMQNRKYNDSVLFIQETIPKMDALMAGINQQRKEDNRAGTVAGVDSESFRAANALAVQSQSWEARMRSYDAYIEVMEANQKIVAQAALKGDPSSAGIAGDLVKTAALKAALSIK